MGFDAYYGAGVGLGLATDTVTGMPYTYGNAIPPGTTVVLWGSGLGADPARDATYLPAAFRIDGLAHIYIGGIDAPIVYQGASGYPGLNQVNVTVPSNVLPGCNVSVVGVTASGVPSNFISLPIGNGPCSDPELGTDGRQLQMLSASGSVYNGSLNLLQATGPGTDGSPVTTNSATASFVDFGWVTYATVTGTVSLGGCIVTQSSGPTLIAEIISPTAGTVTLTGPDGSSSLAYDLGSYSAQLWSGFIPPTGGTFTFSATGGSIGSFNVPVVIAGPPLNWTNQGAAQSVSRSAGLPMAWTGGASNSFVRISGSSSPTAGASYPMGSFSCTVAASAGQFTVPAYVLSALPAGSGGVTVANSNYQTFTAMGLDVGIARAIVSFAVNSSFN
jgi:hypothetical protein